MAIDVAKVAAGFDDVADPALELLGLGEATVDAAVPEDPGRGRRLRLVLDGDDKGAAGRGLERDLAERQGEGGEQLLGVLGRGLKTGVSKKRDASASPSLFLAEGGERGGGGAWPSRPEAGKRT